MTNPEPSMNDIPFLLEALTYAADSRCRCGKGLAYITKGVDGERAKGWYCSAWLRGEIELEREPTPEESTKDRPQGWIKGWAGAGMDSKGQVHDSYPFTFYEFKSENQPSVQGRTTRPS